MKNSNVTNRNRNSDLPACSATEVEKAEILGKAWRQVIAVFEKYWRCFMAAILPTWSNRKFLWLDIKNRA